MRLEVTIPDNSAEAAILGSLSDPSGYVLELVRADRGTRAAKRHNGMPDYVAILAQAEKSPNRFKTREEIDSFVAGLRSEW